MEVTTAESEGPEFVRQVRMEMDRKYIEMRGHIERSWAYGHLYDLLGDWCRELGWPPIRWVQFGLEEKS